MFAVWFHFPTIGSRWPPKRVFKKFDPTGHKLSLFVNRFAAYIGRTSDWGESMWMRLVVCTLGLVGCSEYNFETYGTVPPTPEEETLQEPAPEEDDCIESETGFDIEEVSTLQDAFGLPNVRDGLTLEVSEAFTSDGRTWRPVGVDVLVMYPDWYFDFYDDSNDIQVSIYDSATPSGTPVSVRRTIKKSDLSWSPLLLPADADWSGDNRDQIAAWVHFDFSELTPTEGFQSDRYFVSVEWDDMGFPNVGYSNFELSCQQNWTDYGNGQWKQNTGDDCSWPMFKIDVETRTEGEDCD